MGGLQRGVPTATVGINNSTNAALLAVRILGAYVPEYQDKMRRYQLEMEEQVIVKGDKLREVGDVAYLAAKGGK
jgi:phosphoribosylaminoimidazole carboxylase